MTRPDKNFKPGPESTPDVAPRAPSFGKGRFTTTAPSTVEPVTDEAVIEVTVDDVSVVVRPDEVPDEASISKYDLRPMAGVGSVDLEQDETEEDAQELAVSEDKDQPPLPLGPTPPPLGPWRSESRLDGDRYHRVDTRRL